MLAVLLTLAVAAPAAGTASDGVRSVTVAVYTKKEAPVEDIQPGEVELKEDGKKRTILGVERDERPMAVALLLDSSAAMGSEYRSTLVDAAMAFWNVLPPEAELTIWTSGGRPSKVVDFGVEPAAAEAVLQQVATGGPNFTLDTIIDASRDLQRKRLKRRYVVIVTDSAIEVSRTLIERTYRAIPRARVTPMVVLVKSGPEAAQTWDTETIFEQMTSGYGGSYDLVLTPQASRKMLRRAAADIANQYLVRYESAAEKPGRPEVKIKRKGVRVRPGLSQIAN